MQARGWINRSTFLRHTIQLLLLTIHFALTYTHLVKISYDTLYCLVLAILYFTSLRFLLEILYMDTFPYHSYINRIYRIVLGTHPINVSLFFVQSYTFISSSKEVKVGMLSLDTSKFLCSVLSLLECTPLIFILAIF